LDQAAPARVISWFRYVRHEDRQAYEAAGWAFAADLGPVHGEWSVLMEWIGDGEPNTREATDSHDSAADARVRPGVEMP